MSYNSLFGLGSHLEDAALEGWWQLQETTGTTATDASANARDGVINGMGANPTTTTGPTGYLPSAYDLDGTDDHIEMPDLSVWSGHDASCSQTIALWFNSDAAQTSWLAGIDDEYGLKIHDDSGNYLRYDMFGDNSGNPGQPSIPTSTWKHVVLSWEAGTGGDIYLDGSAYHSYSSADQSADGANRFWLGDRSLAAGSSPFNGGLAGASYFSRDLASSEASELHSGPEPLNTVAPTISGNAAQGSTLTCSTGTWDSQGNGSLTYAYQWTRDGSDISGATSSTYTTQVADVGTAIGCKVLASNDGGSDPAEETASSNTITVAAVSTNSNFSPRLMVLAQQGAFTLDTSAISFSPHSASHNHASDSPALAWSGSLVPDESLHAHAADSTALAWAGSIAPEASSHSHLASSPTLTVLGTLSPNSATHSHLSDSPTLAWSGSLSPDAATHDHQATQPNLTPLIIGVNPDASLHSLTSSEPTLTWSGSLLPNPAAHAHTAASPDVTGVAPQVTPDAATHGHLAAQPVLVYVPSLSPAPSTHALSSSQPSLAWSGTLSPDDALHLLPTDQAVVAIQSDGLLCHDSLHDHTAGSPTLSIRIFGARLHRLRAEIPGIRKVHLN